MQKDGGRGPDYVCTCIVHVQSGTGSEGTLPDLHQKSPKVTLFKKTLSNISTVSILNRLSMVL